MSFLDAFQGYHQIALAPEDQEKTSFITLEGNYYYTMMPFGLKNARATYQRMVTRMQKLTWMITALNRFVSRSAGRCRPFFQLLKKWKVFQ